MKDGIYFNMPEAQYHELRRLGASGIKEILVSISTYWAASAMNEDKEPEDSEALHFILGRAYHTAIFEADQFAKRFLCEPDPADHPGALMTDAAVKRELKDSGQVQTKSGETTEERAMRLQASGFEDGIWSIIMAKWDEKRGDRQALKPRHHRQVMRDIGRIADNPEIHEMVTGGFSEVTILWTCPQTGIPMKARIDKLKIDRFLDLKSFTNPRRKPVNQCIFDQVQYEKHYIQARLYQLAIRMIAELDLQIMDLGDKAPDEQAIEQHLVATIKARPAPLACWYLYQEKGGIPNLLAREIKLQRLPVGDDVNSIGAKGYVPEHDSILARKADIEIAHAKRLYLQAMEAYGPDQPWYPFDMIGEISDNDFSDFFLDARPA